jgi:hypothetical protein
MDFAALCRDYRIDAVTDQHHHVSKGWLGVHCPFCAGSKNYHLGLNPSSGATFCWRCGRHGLEETLARLVPGVGFKELYARYAGRARTQLPQQRSRRERPAKDRASGLPRPLKLPGGFAEPLREHHARYLRRRGFDPQHLEREWQLSSTRPTAQFTAEQQFGNRILIPIHWQGVMVSFQARTIAKDVKPKYKHCPAEHETRTSRTIVYRHREADSPYGICVEGPADVWRLGRHAFAALGIGYSEPQVACIARLYTDVLIAFDPEPGAQKRARKLMGALVMLGVRARIHKLEGDKDPGDLSAEEAQAIVDKLLKEAS